MWVGEAHCPGPLWVERQFIWEMKLLGCSGHGEWGGAENSKEQEQSCQFYGGRLRAEEVQAREPRDLSWGVLTCSGFFGLIRTGNPLPEVTGGREVI